MLELAFKFHDQIINYWKFFVPSTIVLLGWVFARKAAWPWVQRIAVAFAFLGFAIFNLYGLILSYEILNDLVIEMRTVCPPSDMTIDAYKAVVSRFDMGSDWKIGIAFHVVVDIGVLYFLLFESGRKKAS